MPNILAVQQVRDWNAEHQVNMVSERSFSRPLIVAAGKWHLTVPRGELGLLLPHVAAFSKALKLGDSETSTTALEDAAEFLYFLEARKAPNSALISATRLFQRQFLGDNNVHIVANSLPPHLRRTLIRLDTKLHRLSDSTSGLIEAAQNGTASLLAIFGGQGITNTSCLTDLRLALETYHGFVEDIIDAADTCLVSLSTEPRARKFFQGNNFALKAWLDDASTAPSEDKLAQAPFSFPIIGLLSLLQYWIALKSLNVEPTALKDNLVAVTGHSQGVVAAAVVAVSDSWSALKNNILVALRILFWVGLESHLAAPQTRLPLQIRLESEARYEGMPSYMLSVRGLPVTTLQEFVHNANQDFAQDQHIFVALRNNVNHFIVAGPLKSLVGFRQLLMTLGASENLDQSRVPYPHRKPIITCTFLPISAPFHSPYLLDAATRVLRCVQADEWLISTSPASLLDTSTGEECHFLSSTELVSKLVHMVMTQPVDWPKACLRRRVSHILDFGPGKTSLLLRSSIEGSSMQAVLLSEPNTDTMNFLPLIAFYTPSTPNACISWEEEFQPHCHPTDGSIRFDTKFTRVFRAPPIFVAGMTPTTASHTLVSAIIEAGYHVELAGGGHPNPTEFEGAVRAAASKLPPSRGLTCNIIYVNPRQVAWQIPLIRSLTTQGVRIDGLTVGGGVPSVQIASEWIRTLGLRHISFKPGSHLAIEQVLEIADMNPAFPIGLQWTGGRAGGHHSYEDFHEPMLKWYGTIRRRKNIILIAGGGFGHAESIAPYLSGHWSVPYGRPCMPFDAVLLGSHIMTAKEAKTSDAVKNLMVSAPGCADREWTESYTRPIGGVMTVLSEMRQPIHVLANRAMILWKYLDDEVFALSKVEDRVKKIADPETDLKARLNNDFAKPWFATVRSCTIELDDMTYRETMERLVELMHPSTIQKWIDPSYRGLVRDWMRRIAQRCCPGSSVSIPSMEEASQGLKDFLLQLSDRADDIMYPEDVSYFLNLCRRPGQKPVNFIPALDENFETWFKKDSLWQSEHLEAVPNQDAERVCIIHGPVAAPYTTTSDEPVAFMLNRIITDLSKLLSTTIPSIPQGVSSSIQEMSDSLVNEKPHRWTRQLEEDDLRAEHTALVCALIPAELHWARISLLDKYVMRHGRLVENPIRMAFRPQLHDEIIIDQQVAGVQHIVLQSNSKNLSPSRRQLRLEYVSNDNLRLLLFTPKSEIADARLELQFTIQSSYGSSFVRETTNARNTCIANFYREIWDTPDMHITQDIVLHRELVESFMNVIGSVDKTGKLAYPQNKRMPMDLCIVVAWKAMMQGLLSSQYNGSLSRLLHRSITFEYQPNCPVLMIGDSLQAKSRVTAIKNTTNGNSVSIAVDICRDGQNVVEVVSEFIIQGNFGSSENDFELVKEPSIALEVDSLKLQAVLKSRSWLQLCEPNLDLFRSKLIFQLQSLVKKGRTMVTGSLSLALKNGALRAIGEIHFDREVAPRNPVMEFLHRHGRHLREEVPLQHPGWHSGSPIYLQMPATGDAYSNVSLDRNPIHTCPYFAGFAGLDHPIAHGMYTSAIVRRVVEEHVANGDSTRFRKWQCFFDAMIYYGQTIEVIMEHTAMVEGRILIHVKVFEAITKKQVLHAVAEVEQPPTAYMFCGQGSQEKGMGMQLYESNVIARDVWNRGDRYLLELYGFSLLDIVRNDPKELTINFGGKRGKHLRQNYLNVSRKVFHNGKWSSQPVLEGLSRHSSSYTFSDHRGLLFSTQFAQPALTMMEIAAMRALEAQGCVQQQASFAGHSLGEYSALAACTTFMSLEELLNLVFYRGLLMQRAVERDENGQTKFSMVAVNPSKVGTWFDEKHFEVMVGFIAKESNLLLEVVNWNIEGQQYVCAGDLRALLLLGQVCDKIAYNPITAPEALLGVVKQFLPCCMSSIDIITLPKGIATTPLVGIDVPFHSTVLRSGIEGYRSYLTEKIPLERIIPSQFVGKWIPNVIGKPFSLDRAYVEEVQKITNSHPLKVLLEASA